MGTIFYNSGSQWETICKNTSLVYDLARIEYTPLLPLQNGSTTLLYIYESGVKGIGLGPQIRGDSFNVAIT